MVTRFKLFGLLILLFLGLFSFSARAEGLYLRYRVSWEFLPVGQIEIWKFKTQAIAYARTTGLGALIFPFKSLWRTETTLNGEPLRTEIQILEKGHPKRKRFLFERIPPRVIKEKVTPQKFRREIFEVSYPLYDELTGFLKALGFRWKHPGESRQLPVFAGKRVYFARLFYRGPKEVRTFRGWEEIKEVEVELPFESELIQRSRHIWVYLSPEGLPVMVAGRIRLGHLRAYLLKASDTDSAPPPPAALLRTPLPEPDSELPKDSRSGE